MTAQSKTVIKSYFETWKEIPGFPNYEASDQGHIRNAIKGNILKPVVWGKRGHVAVKVGGGRKAGKQYIHRLVLLAFRGPAPEGQIGCHKNDVKTDNHLENLYWGTYKSNFEDSIRNGKYFGLPKQEHGERNQNAKYSDELISSIRAEYNEKPRKRRDGTMKFLCEKYKIPFPTMSGIINEKSRANG